jgi:hypothetical protein
MLQAYFDGTKPKKLGVLAGPLGFEPKTFSVEGKENARAS